jgi:benzoyl-CoA-dihydrodiol lyase
MEHTSTTPEAPVRFETHPSRYVHWKLEIEAPVARLLMDVQEDRGLRPGYPLKLNSYDLSVDIELADAVQRLRFEHPEVPPSSSPAARTVSSARARTSTCSDPPPTPSR